MSVCSVCNMIIWPLQKRAKLRKKVIIQKTKSTTITEEFNVSIHEKCIPEEEK